MKKNTNLTVSILLISLVIIWGSSFMLMKKAMYGPGGNELYTPFQVGALRMFLAGIVLLPFILRDFNKVKKKHILPLLGVGLFGNCLPAFLFPAAETVLKSSYVGMLNSLVPLLTLIIALSVFKVKVSKLNITGIGLGMIGALLLSITDGSNDGSFSAPHVLMVIGATLCYAISLNIIKHYLQNLPPVTITSFAFSWLIIPMGIYIFSTDTVTISTNQSGGGQAFFYVVILAILGTSIAVIMFNKLIHMTNQIVASSVTYLIPVVAIILGIMDGEKLFLYQILAFILILCGVILVNLKENKSETH